MAHNKSYAVLASDEARPFLEPISLRASDQTSNSSFSIRRVDELIEDLLDRYEFANYNHALEILATAYPEEWAEMLFALAHLRITVRDIQEAGGNKSVIPKRFESLLTPLGWREERISAELIIRRFPRVGNKFASTPSDTVRIADYIDGHNIDFVKGRVACDMEWNSKDQTFDRDLMAFRAYHECGAIKVGIIVTRSGALDELIGRIPRGEDSPQKLTAKYGASTTWMGKLVPRLDSRRNGACPVLAIGILPATIEGREAYD